VDEDEEDRPRRRRPRRDRDDDDDDDDDDRGFGSSRRRSSGISATTLMNLKVLGFVAALFLAVVFASIFAKGLASMVFLGSYSIGLIVAMMTVRAATSEGGGIAGLCVLFGIFTALAAIGAVINVSLEPEWVPLKWPYSLAYFFSTFFWSSFLGLYVAGHWKESKSFAIVWLTALVVCMIMYIMVLINYGRLEARREEKWKDIKPAQLPVVRVFEVAALETGRAGSVSDGANVG
jgi:hypothetical protein